MTANEESPGRRIDRGDIYWIEPASLERAPDAAHGSPRYMHPHVVVQDNVFNHSRITTVVVCALSTNLRRANEPGNVLLDPAEGDLPKQSVVIVSRISSVQKSCLKARIGVLSEARVDQIVAGLRFQQRSFFGR